MRWKWILLGVVGLIVVFVITVYIILSSYSFNSLKPQITKAARDATGRDLILGGDIRLKIGLTPALVVENVSFQNAAWGSRPEMAKIKRFEVQVALVPLLSKTIQLKRVILVEPDILIETDKSGRSNLAFDTGKKAAPEKPKEEPAPKKEMKLPSLAMDEFRIEKAKVTYRDDRTGKAMVVSLDSLTASAKGTESPMQMSLKGAYNSEPFEVEGTLGPLAGLTSPGKPWPIKVTAKAFAATFTLDGAIKDVQAQKGIDLGFGVKGSDLSTLGKAAGKPLPLKGPFDVSGRVSDPAPKAYRISNLKVALGGSDLAGTVEVQMGGQRPGLTANLSSQKLDVRSMMPESTSSGSAKPEGKASKEPAKAVQTRERLLPSDPLPLESLGQADAKVKFQVGQLLLPMITLNDLSVDMNLQDGRLAIHPFKAGMSGGKLNAQLDLKAQGKTAVLSAVMKMDGIALGPMLKEARKIEGIEGRLDADLNVKGQGGSVAGILGGLNGKSVITMKEGKIDNTYIDLLAGDLKGVLFKLLGLSQDSKFTVINCFVSGYTIKDGRADTTAFVLDTNQMGIVGDGEINLKTEGLNLTFTPSTKGSIGSGKMGKVSVGLGDLAQAFKLTGTFAQPSMSIDTSQAAAGIARMLGAGGLGKQLGLPAPSGSGGQIEGDLCSRAMEAANKGVKMGAATKGGTQGAPQPAQTPEQAIKDLGQGLKKLFGK
jgi:AsmA family protein